MAYGRETRINPQAWCTVDITQDTYRLLQQHGRLPFIRPPEAVWRDPERNVTWVRMQLRIRTAFAWRRIMQAKGFLTYDQTMRWAVANPDAEVVTGIYFEEKDKP